MKIMGEREGFWLGFIEVLSYTKVPSPSLALKKTVKGAFYRRKLISFVDAVAAFGKMLAFYQIEVA